MTRRELIDTYISHNILTPCRYGTRQGYERLEMEHISYLSFMDIFCTVYLVFLQLLLNFLPIFQFFTISETGI